MLLVSDPAAQTGSAMLPIRLRVGIMVMSMMKIMMLMMMEVKMGMMIGLPLVS